MEIQSQETADQFTARLAGRMTFGDSSAFRDLLEAMGRSPAKSCVMDLSALVSVDSAGLGMFIIAAEAARKNGVTLVLDRPAGQVRQLLGLARFDRLMTIRE